MTTAYLHAPIERDIYMNQPEGYETTSQGNTKLLYNWEKSLNGLKQSGRNWKQMLHVHCVYTKVTGPPCEAEYMSLSSVYSTARVTKHRWSGI